MNNTAVVETLLEEIEVHIKQFIYHSMTILNDQQHLKESVELMIVVYNSLVAGSTQLLDGGQTLLNETGTSLEVLAQVLF